MPNSIDVNGIQILTLAQIIDQILNGTAQYPGYYQIYGADINVGPNTPDGQQINIYAQSAEDILEFIRQVYNSFDPDVAIGRVLDQRCAINGVVRRGATYTQTMIDVTVTGALTLAGLDTNPTAPFTISDASGNQFQLVTAHSFSGSGTTSLLFQAAVLGAVQTTPNTITQIVTVTLGVSAVNNPAATTVLGVAEETDAALRIRRSNSVSLPSRGYLEGLIGALQDVDGVTQAIVRENDTNGTVGGIPGHSIWVIVLGGANADVADAIYRKRNAGCGMRGSVTVNVPQVDGTTFPISFDRPTPEDLWISFDVVAITGSVDDDYIRQQILKLLSYNINQAADTTTIVALIKAISPNASVSNEGVSDDGGATYGPLKTPTDVNYQFGISSPHIIINGTPGT